MVEIAIATFGFEDSAEFVNYSSLFKNFDTPSIFDLEDFDHYCGAYLGDFESLEEK